MYSSYNVAHMGTRLMIIKLAQGVSAVMTVYKRKTQKCTQQHLHCILEKYPVDSNITGLVSEIHKHDVSGIKRFGTD